MSSLESWQTLPGVNSEIIQQAQSNLHETPELYAWQRPLRFRYNGVRQWTFAMATHIRNRPTRFLIFPMDNQCVVSRWTSVSKIRYGHWQKEEEAVNDHAFAVSDQNISTHPTSTVNDLVARTGR